jgi:hypothetical protein
MVRVRKKPRPNTNAHCECLRNILNINRQTERVQLNGTVGLVGGADVFFSLLSPTSDVCMNLPFRVSKILKSYVEKLSCRSGMLGTEETRSVFVVEGRSQWPRGLRRGSAAAHLLGLRVRNPLGAWMPMSCVLLGRGLCDGLITRPEESCQVCVCV